MQGFYLGKFCTYRGMKKTGLDRGKATCGMVITEGAGLRQWENPRA